MGLMTHGEYEQLVASTLETEGWNTTLTPPAGDKGLDVIAERDGARIGVQAKMYLQANRPINAAIVMLTYGAAAYADCTGSMVVTDGRVLPDAARVAAKLGVEIRALAAVARTPAKGGGKKIDEPTLSFDRIWSENIEPLVGRTLTRNSGSANEIIAVDSGGIVRRTSRGKTQRIDIEIFRWTVQRILQGHIVLREDINAQSLDRVSSGVMLILSTVPLFETVTSGRKQGLRLRDGSTAERS